MDASKDTPPARRPPLTLPQFLAMAAVVVALLIGLDFSQRLARENYLVASVNQESTEVAILAAEHADLKTQVAYATTDAAVIEWAHSSGKMVLPGEVLVAPILPTPAPTQPPAPPPTALPPPTWLLWRNLFFDDAARTP